MTAAALVMRRATAADAGALTALTRASKAYWPYDAEFLRLVDADLVVPAADLASGALHGEVATVDGAIAGCFAFRGEKGSLWLDSLFVEPEWIGRGVGRALWERALACARALGAHAFTFESDPHADRFYVRMGAIRTGAHASRVDPSRTLSLFRVDLNATPSKG